MDVVIAIKNFRRLFPDKKLRGYIKTKDSVILVTKPGLNKNHAEICYYVCSPDGSVSATNPLWTPEITTNDMTPLLKDKKQGV